MLLLYADYEQEVGPIPLLQGHRKGLKSVAKEWRAQNNIAEPVYDPGTMTYGRKIWSRLQFTHYKNSSSYVHVAGTLSPSLFQTLSTTFSRTAEPFRRLSGAGLPDEEQKESDVAPRAPMGYAEFLHSAVKAEPLTPSEPTIPTSPLPSSDHPNTIQKPIWHVHRKLAHRYHRHSKVAADGGGILEEESSKGKDQEDIEDWDDLIGCTSMETGKTYFRGESGERAWDTQREELPQGDEPKEGRETIQKTIEDNSDSEDDSEDSWGARRRRRRRRSTRRHGETAGGVGRRRSGGHVSRKE